MIKHNSCQQNMYNIYLKKQMAAQIPQDYNKIQRIITRQNAAKLRHNFDIIGHDQDIIQQD